MKSFFQKMTLTYLSYSFRNESGGKREDIVRRAIDFMVRTDSFLYLFTTIFEAIKSYSLTGVFFVELEQYVESGHIKCMTE